MFLVIRLILTGPDEQTIYRFLDAQSGALGMWIAAIIGSIAMIPGFVAFPLTASLLNAGASYGQITMFVNTLKIAFILEKTLTKQDK